MIYNFDEVVDRSQNYAVKLEEAEEHFGRRDLIPLWVADMDFKTAPCVVEAITKRAQQGIFGYTWRSPRYYESISRFQQRRHGWAAPTERMAFAPGVVSGMRMVLQLFTKPGDKILIQPPVYHPFSTIIHNSGRELVENPLLRQADGTYGLDLADFERKLQGGVKLFLLCNPHNPVGRSWTQEELSAMGELCLRYGVEILSDEIHGDLMLYGHRHIPMASLSPALAAHCCTCISPSKTFNLAGLQAATLVFDSVEKKQRYEKEQERMAFGRNNCFSLVATMAAYEEGEEWLDQLLHYLEGNMDFLQAFCKEQLPELKPNRPEATYLNWLDARALGLSDDELQRLCVQEAGVAFNRGTDFGRGGEGFLRVNCACPRSVLEKAFRQLEAAIHRR